MLKEKVYLTIEKYKMFQQGDKVVIGVSGGLDSVALLYILKLLQKKLNLTLYVAHLNHMFRGKEAKDDAYYVEKLAKTWQIPVVIESFNVPEFAQKEKLSPEDAARQVRYIFFARISSQYKVSKIAVGHTKEDQVETILMRLIRGVGTEGLEGIPPIRNLQEKPLLQIVRPLIETSRQEIGSFLSEHHLHPRLDSSNLKSIYLRNKVRYKLLPLLEKEYNPNIRQTLLSTILILKEENEYLEKETEKISSKILERKKKKIILNLENFSFYSRAIQRRILRKAIAFLKGNLQGITFQHLENILKIIERPSGNLQIDLPCNIIVYKAYKQLVIAKEEKREKVNYNCILSVPGITEVPEINLRVKTEIINAPTITFKKNGMCAYFDAQKIKFPLILRNRKAGDKFHPLGLEGTKKIKDFFIDRKILLKEREKIPLLISEKEVVWVVGKQIAEEVKITTRTKKILKIDLRKLKGGMDFA